MPQVKSTQETVSTQQSATALAPAYGAFYGLPAAPAAPSPTSVKGMASAPFLAAQGVPGAWKGVLQATLFRSLLIGGGLFVAGVRSPKQLGVGAIAASSTITLLQVASHAIRAR